MEDRSRLDRSSMNFGGMGSEPLSRDPNPSCSRAEDPTYSAAKQNVNDAITSGFDSKGKIQHVLSELKVSELSVPENLAKTSRRGGSRLHRRLCRHAKRFRKNGRGAAHDQDRRGAAIQAQAATDTVRASTVSGSGSRTSARDRSDLSSGSGSVSVRLEDSLGDEERRNAADVRRLPRPERTNGEGCVSASTH